MIIIAIGLLSGQRRMDKPVKSEKELKDMVHRCQMSFMNLDKENLFTIEAERVTPIKPAITTRRKVSNSNNGKENEESRISLNYSTTTNTNTKGSKTSRLILTDRTNIGETTSSRSCKSCLKPSTSIRAPNGLCPNCMFHHMK